MNQLCDPALIPVTEWPEFLDDAEAAALLDFAIAHEKDFKPARTHKGEDPDTRKSLVTLDLGPFKEILKDRVKAALPELAARLKIRGVTGDKFEIELAAHGEGAFFRNHIDTQTEFSEWKDMRSARAISAAYYLNRTPAHFSGGALRLLRLTKVNSWPTQPLFL